MRSVTPGLRIVLCFLFALAGRPVEASESALSAIPTDAVGFVVVHNIRETSRTLGELAKLVQAPAPDVLDLAKGMSGIDKGIDEQGDLAVVLTNVNAVPSGI